MLLASLLLSALPSVPLSSQGDASAFLGCWRDAAGDVLWIEATRCGWLERGKASFFRARYEEHRALLERFARPRVVALARDGDALLVGTGAAARRYEPVDALPPELALPPLEVAAPLELDAETLEALRAELAERHVADQRVRQGQVDPAAMGAVDRENTAVLRELLAEVGWIDVERFGRAANEAAFLIVQHSGDLRLMKTALPYIERELATAHTDPQLFALLHDRLQLALGHPQRYGSQLNGLADGRFVVMPLEDRAGVDRLRAELGMTPLADYLALFAEDGATPAFLGDLDLFAGT